LLSKIGNFSATFLKIGGKRNKPNTNAKAPAIMEPSIISPNAVKINIPPAAYFTFTKCSLFIIENNFISPVPREV